MDKTSLGDRMKGYERSSKDILPARMPIIIRVDGVAFHTWTKTVGCKRPFDNRLIQAMQEIAALMCKKMHTCVFAYTQSDEISFLMHNYKRINTQPWLGNVIQKIVSHSAAMASAAMSLRYQYPTFFDSRVFVMPENDVVNYFIWRQQDATRNSIQMLARSQFSHKECHKKSCDDLQEMLFQERGMNWNDTETHKKRGSCVYKSDEGWIIDKEIPIFTQDRHFIKQHLATVEA